MEAQRELLQKKITFADVLEEFFDRMVTTDSTIEEEMNALSGGALTNSLMSNDKLLKYNNKNAIVGFATEELKEKNTNPNDVLLSN